jgi:hypothetical protein
MVSGVLYTLLKEPTKLLGGEGKDRCGAGSGTHLNEASLEKA